MARNLSTYLIALSKRAVRVQQFFAERKFPFFDSAFSLDTGCRFGHSAAVSSHKLSSPKGYELVADYLRDLPGDIRKELDSELPVLRDISHYYFDGKGKAFRPMITLLMALACNCHVGGDRSVHLNQYRIAMVAEMIHTASLIHDDVIDDADVRRGKPAANILWGEKLTILGGDYILARSSQTIARTKNPQVVFLISQIIEDLVRGEFMQLGSKEERCDRFSHYIEKSFRKTASLLAHSCQAVAVACVGDEELQRCAFSYGRNTGLAFQLIDDVLDFVSSSDVLGKPAAADLKQGLATAPVLFAAEEHPELNAMIMRRFSNEGDVEKAQEWVAKSGGVERTRNLAEQHCAEAVEAVQKLSNSAERDALVDITTDILTRKK